VHLIIQLKIFNKKSKKLALCISPGKVIIKAIKERYSIINILNIYLLGKKQFNLSNIA